MVGGREERSVVGRGGEGRGGKSGVWWAEEGRGGEEEWGVVGRGGEGREERGVVGRGGEGGEGCGGCESSPHKMERDLISLCHLKHKCTHPLHRLRRGARYSTCLSAVTHCKLQLLVALVHLTADLFL